MSVYVFIFDTKVLYIGSTFNVNQRLSQHKSKLKNGDEMPLYNYLRLHNIKTEDLKVKIFETNFGKENLLEFERRLKKACAPICNKK